jgi:hypothetical protein
MGMVSPSHSCQPADGLDVNLGRHRLPGPNQVFEVAALADALELSRRRTFKFRWTSRPAARTETPASGAVAERCNDIVPKRLAKARADEEKRVKKFARRRNKDAGK